MQDITQAPRLAELDNRLLGERLSIFQAMEKMISEELKALKGEMRQRLADAQGDFDSIPLTIGDKKVGRYYTTASTPGVEDDEAFGEWAFCRGDGVCEIKITIDRDSIAGFDSPGEIYAFVEEMLDIISSETSRYPVNWPTVTYKANPGVIKNLSVVAGKVVDDLGEIVPGTYAKAPQGRITPIKPHEVAKAMRAARQNPSVVALLEG